MANKAIKFYRGLRASYNSVTHAEGIYFATDTHEILVNGVNYGTDVTKKIQDVKLNESANGLVVTYTTGESTTLLISKASVSVDGLMSKEDKKKLDSLDESISNSYQSALNPDIATVEKLGGIDAGTTVANLTGKSYNEIFDTLIFPTVNPEWTDPTARISFKGITLIFVEVGAAAPVADRFVGSYNPGQITIAGKFQANRGGAQKMEESKIVFGPNKIDTLPLKATKGEMKYYYRAAYEEGPQPKNSKGGNYGSPLAAGTVDSSAITITGCYPAYSGLISTNSITEDVIKGMKKTISNKKVINVSGPISEQYICFAAPEGWTVTNIKDSNNFDVTSTYKKSTIAVTGLDGKSINYTVYLSGKMSQPSTYSVNFN